MTSGRRSREREREQILSQERGTFSMEGDNDVPKSVQRQSPLAVINLEDVTHGNRTDDCEKGRDNDGERPEGPFGNTPSTIRDRFMLRGLKLGQS